MTWDTGRPADPLGLGPEGHEKLETIELVGPHLRVSGQISLLRFSRLSDLLNHTHGYLKVTGAQLLRRNGDPTNLVVPSLMISQDEITFVAQKEENVSTERTGAVGGMDRPLMQRVPREIVVFTEGHTLTGMIHLFAETDVETFVDSPDPRFVPMTEVTARSLADRRVISHFGLALVNRTRIVAAALREFSGTAVETGVSVD